MLSIGEFSTASHITIKALRLYHEQGILVPELVDGESGYRYYGWRSLERAKAITALKEMGFSLSEIGDLLEKDITESQLSEALEKKLGQIEAGIREQRAAQKKIREYMRMQLADGEATQLREAPVEFERFEDVLVLGLRVRARYREMGRVIGEIFRRAGRHAAGGPFCLYYEMEYTDEDADYEVCVPARQRTGIEGLDCRILPGGRAAVVTHHGPYETIGRSYAKLFAFMREKNLRPELPFREIYMKGPGIILYGDPRRFRTKLAFMTGD